MQLKKPNAAFKRSLLATQNDSTLLPRARHHGRRVRQHPRVSLHHGPLQPRAGRQQGAPTLRAGERDIRFPPRGEDSHSNNNNNNNNRSYQAAFHGATQHRLKCQTAARLVITLYSCDAISDLSSSSLLHKLGNIPTNRHPTIPLIRVSKLMTDIHYSDAAEAVSVLYCTVLYYSLQ